jgi:hypothetical protein
MEGVTSITVKEFKSFIEHVSKTFKIPIESLSTEWDNLKEKANLVKACVAIKKDKTICGKKATAGAKCSLHKKRVKPIQKEVLVQKVLEEGQVVVRSNDQDLCTFVEDNRMCLKEADCTNRCGAHVNTLGHICLNRLDFVLKTLDAPSYVDFLDMEQPGVVFEPFTSILEIE